MSSILDALQRAERERQAAGPGPGADQGWALAASVPARETASGPSRESPQGQAGRRLRGLAFLVLAVATATSLAWWWAGRYLQAGPAVAAAPKSPPLLAPSAEARPAAPAVTQGSTPTAAPEARQTPTTRPAPRVAHESTRATAALEPVRPRPVPDAPSPVPLLSYGQLPVATQRDMGPLALTGLVYSASPASRLLMLEGQVLKEGDLVRPGLKVLRITPDGAVLAWRDQRFALRLTTSP